MKKTTQPKQQKRKLVLDRESIKKLDEQSLEKVVGGGSCLQWPPLAES
jgi:hypothetical protein